MPFAVPAPLPTRAGDTIVRLPGGERLAALFELIPGQPPDRTNPVHWVGRLRAGQAEPGLVREQAERLLALDDFLEREGERLIGTLAGA